MFPANDSMLRRPLPSAGSPWSECPGFAGTTSRSDSRISFPPHFVSFAWRYPVCYLSFVLPTAAPIAAGRPRNGPRVSCGRLPGSGFQRGDIRASQVPGEPLCQHAPLLDPGQAACLMTRFPDTRCCLRQLPTVSALTISCLSGLDHAACWLAVYASHAGIAPRTRKTRFRLAGRLCRVGFSLPQGSS
jgi:hypothetical protein